MRLSGLMLQNKDDRIPEIGAFQICIRAGNWACGTLLDGCQNFPYGTFFFFFATIYIPRKTGRRLLFVVL